jgi:integrase
VLEQWARRCDQRVGASGFVWTRLEHTLSGHEGRVSGEGSWSISREQLSADSIYQIIRRRAAAAGVEATPHALRRSYATALRDAGVSLDTIRRYLGHASIQTTIRYLSPQDEEAASAVRSLSLGVAAPAKRRR